MLVLAALLLAGCPTEPAGADPRFASCAEATAAGYGPYTSGDPEYGWHDDRDGDGTVCER